MNDIEFYLLDTNRDDWDENLASWKELIPPGSFPWLLSKFGELFFEQPDTRIGVLQPSCFQYEIVAEDKQDFEERLMDPDKLSEWFLAPLVHQLERSGKELEGDRCYSFITALGLGGELTEENVMMVPVKEHFQMLGDIFQQIKDLPDGSEIKIVVTDE